MKKNPAGIKSDKNGGRRKEPKKTKSARAAEIEPDEGLETAFPIVGIGASAGGLEAFTELLKNLPTNTGMAFVLIQHQAPSHVSLLPEIISRSTQMKVSAVEDGMTVEPDQVYVIPPGTDMAVLHGRLSLMAYKDYPTQHLPIDYFLRTLAKDRGGNAIGVILSGTASDGTLGLMAIKAEGGITFAQDATAKYDGMPKSAIAAGCVDLVLPPEAIARELVRISRYPMELGRAAMAETSFNQELLNKIYIILRESSGVDFTYYKPATMKRRIKRRMVLHKVERLEDYLKFLQSNSVEVNALYQDMLINVTVFFRDPESFLTLKNEVFPMIMEKRAPDAPVRIWVPGCSTGEEAYSIAIALLEYLGENATAVPIQIFATDIDDKALDAARSGRYPESISADVSPERLKRFFVKTDKGLQISKHIRDMCVFARHNLIKDPPFSRLDLISCRNVLIYLGPILQKKLLPIFHYALNPNGMLMLGTSETVGGFADLFTLIDKKYKAYIKKLTPLKPIVQFSTGDHTAETEHVAVTMRKEERVRVDLKKETDRLIISRYSPPFIVVNSEMDVLQFSGRTGPYIEHAPGDASLNLLRMAREGYLFELRKALDRAIKEGGAIRKDGLKSVYDNKIRNFDLEVIPVTHAGAERFFIIVFNEKLPPPPEKAEPEKGSKRKTRDKEMEGLNQELSSTKEYLQSIIESQEMANEELRSANEEIQSTNEELQSTNEELETAKEELQSSNEELNTVNEELENRNDELTRLNDDLSNLLSSVRIPILILDRDLRIRRFTSLTEKVLNLIPTDIGRPITDIKPNFDIESFEETVRDVIDRITSSEREVRDLDGHWYRMRVLPYKTAGNRIEGAVVLFIDIDDLKRGVAEAIEAGDYAQAVFSVLRRPLLVLDHELKVLSASDSYLTMFGCAEKDIKGLLFHRICGGIWAIPLLRDTLEEAVSKEGSFSDLAIGIKNERLGKKALKVSGRLIRFGKVQKVLVVLEFEEK